MLRHLFRIFFLCLFFIVAQHSEKVHAAETRGLRVVAKDQITNQTAEVKLYNKSYAVIIGIDRYPNLPQDRQLSYAVTPIAPVMMIDKNDRRFVTGYGVADYINHGNNLATIDWEDFSSRYQAPA